MYGCEVIAKIAFWIMAARDLYLGTRGKFENGTIVILDPENVGFKKNLSSYVVWLLSYSEK